MVSHKSLNLKYNRYWESRWEIIWSQNVEYCIETFISDSDLKIFEYKILNWIEHLVWADIIYIMQFWFT